MAEQLYRVTDGLLRQPSRCRKRSVCGYYTIRSRWTDRWACSEGTVGCRRVVGLPTRLPYGSWKPQSRPARSSQAPAIGPCLLETQQSQPWVGSGARLAGRRPLRSAGRGRAQGTMIRPPASEPAHIVIRLHVRQALRLGSSANRLPSCTAVQQDTDDEIDIRVRQDTSSSHAVSRILQGQPFA